MSTKLSSTVGTWALKPTTNAPAENAFTVGLSPEGNETALRDDARKPVDAKDIQPGGKYYSIVKLQIKYEKQDASDNRWAQGSGWLVKPDLLVTAGHCAYDHTYGLGRACHIKVYVGYAGKESIGKPGVQFRNGARILTPSGWLKSDTNRQNDVAFVKLDKPFQNITPIKYQPTPATGKLTLGVVGYPADKTYKDESAARMYAQFKTVPIDLPSTFLHMLEYTISSYGGQSGSPVLIQGQNVSVGTHVYGLGDKNSASVIRGKFGNFYRSYENAFAGTIAAPAANARWTTLDLPATEDIIEDAPPSDAEGFWSTLKKIVHVGAKVGSGILTAGSPFLGPIGGPIAAVAGTALRVASKATEMEMSGEASMEGDGETARIPPGIPHNQYLCRSILSEAALQAVLKMDAETATKYGIFKHMEKVYYLNKPYVRPAAKLIGPTLVLPATRIALNSIAPPASTVAPYPAVPRPVGTENSFDGREEAFIAACEAAATSEGGAEGFLSFLKPLISTAIKVTPAIIKAARGEGEFEGEATVLDGETTLDGEAVLDGEAALGDEGAESWFKFLKPLASIVASVVGESDFEGEAAVEGFESDLQPHAETLCHRALLGEAALQAIMTIPTEQLQKENIFTNIVKVLKNTARTAIKVAPSVIRVVEPIVHQIIQDKLNKRGGESSFELGTINPMHRSVDDLLNDDSLTQAPTSSDVPKQDQQSNGQTNGLPAEEPIDQSNGVPTKPSKIEPAVMPYNIRPSRPGIKMAPSISAF